MTVYTLSAAEIVRLADAFIWAADNGARVRIAVEDGLKIAVGGEAWSLPMGTDTTGRS